MVWKFLTNTAVVTPPTYASHVATTISRLLTTGFHWSESASWAWVAGVFEGDGSISGRRTRTRLALKMTDRDVVERFADVVGGTVSGPHPSGAKYKPRWYAYASGETRMIDCYVAMEPFLGARRRARFQEALIGADAEARVTTWVPQRWLWYPWAAGLFEAEGSVSFDSAPRLDLSSTDHDVVARFAEVLGGRVYGPYKQKPSAMGTLRKPISRWVVCGHAAEAAATALRPWLGERRRQRLEDVFVARKFYRRPAQPTFLGFRLWD